MGRRRRVVQVKVRRRKADLTTPPIAMNHQTKEGWGTTQHSLCPVQLALQHRVSYGTRRHALPSHFERAPDAHLQIPVARPKVLGRALGSLAKGRVKAEEEMVTAEAAKQNLLDEPIRGPSGQLRVEVQHNRVRNPAALKEKEPVIERTENSWGHLPENSEWVLPKGDDHRLTIELLAPTAELVEEPLVPPMDTVEDPNGCHGSRQRLLEKLIEAAVNLQGTLSLANGLRRCPNSWSKGPPGR